MGRQQFVYAIFRSGPMEYQVVKFDELGNSEDPPAAIYRVVWDADKRWGKCNCPAATYRNTGTGDKHIKLVREWLANGEKFPEGGPTCLN